ncbi:MAG: hypothetical protein APR63_05390 [Desulfuromonas sp. SDB]|nr:MAG: hypothetical protein APR63_05390 [Desulfuromonas sp. SDB]
MIISLFVLMLIFHLAHVLEEVWGSFFIMDSVLGLEWFVVINGILWCVPLIILFFLIKGKNFAYKVAIIYAFIMVINGFAHNVLTLITGKYYRGFAGGITGIGLVLTGVLLLVFIWKKFIIIKKL